MTDYEISYIPHAHTGQPVPVRRPIRRKDPSMITVELSTTSAYLLHAAISNRLEEITLYHINHPDLPRQDDIAAGYEAALDALRKAGVKV
jgi:hypothetical protein